MRAPAFDVIEHARRYRYLRETATQNRGLRVESVQHWSGGTYGDSWCLEFVWWILDAAYQGNPPFERMQACETLHLWAQANGCLFATPAIGDLFLRLTPEGHAHHVGFVTQLYPDRVGTIAGNTSEDGKSSNGDRVAEHDLALDGSLVFVRYAQVAIGE